MRTSNYRKKLNINKKVLHYILIGILALLLAGTIAFFVYFRVTKIEVMGSTHYTDDEIKEFVLHGPMASNAVLAPRFYSRKNVEDVPFIEAYEVTQTGRNTITISVKESQPVGCVPFLDCYMYFDRGGIIIESSVERDEKIPYFDGLDIPYVEMDEEIPLKNDSVLNTAISLARIFEKNDMIPDHIIFDDKYTITLEYGDITVNLGKDTYLEDKMARLLAILPQVTGQKGIIHMENVTGETKNITFERELTKEEQAALDEANGDESSTDEEDTEGTDESGDGITYDSENSDDESDTGSYDTYSYDEGNSDYQSLDEEDSEY